MEIIKKKNVKKYIIIILIINKINGKKTIFIFFNLQ